MRRADQSGQVMVLALGLALVVFSVSGLAVDGTRAFLERRSLQNVADAATVAAASEIDAGVYYRSGGETVRVSAAKAEAVALRLMGERGLPGRVSISIDNNSVSIVVRSEAKTTFLRLVGVDEIPVAASASAEPFAQEVPLGR